MSKIETLRDKYPKIFPPQKYNTELSVGDGWFQLLDNLCEKLQTLSDLTNNQVVATQVKEKFGGLRFYVAEYGPEIDELIVAAEHEADRTCEVCGAPGKARNDSWIKTLCDTHAAERNK